MHRLVSVQWSQLWSHRWPENSLSGVPLGQGCWQAPSHIAVCSGYVWCWHSKSLLRHCFNLWKLRRSRLLQSLGETFAAGSWLHCIRRIPWWEICSGPRSRRCSWVLSFDKSFTTPQVPRVGCFGWLCYQPVVREDVTDIIVVVTMLLICRGLQPKISRNLGRLN